MDRREFLASSAIAPAATGEGIKSQKESPAKKLPFVMKCSCHAGPLTDEQLEFLRRHSVDAVCGFPAGPRDGRRWEVDELAQFRERIQKHGLILDMNALRFLGLTHINKKEWL